MHLIYLHRSYIQQSHVLSHNIGNKVRVVNRTPDKNCRKAEKQKQPADEASWHQLGWQCQDPPDVCHGSAILWQSTVPQFGHGLLTLG